MLACLPEKEKRKYLSLNTKATVKEIQEAESELLKWQNNAIKVDKSITSNNKDSYEIKKNIPAVRGSKTSQPVKPTDNTNLSISIINESPHLSVLSKTQLNKISQLRTQLEVNSLSEERRKYKASK